MSLKISCAQDLYLSVSECSSYSSIRSANSTLNVGQDERPDRPEPQSCGSSCSADYPRIPGSETYPGFETAAPRVSDPSWLRIARVRLPRTDPKIPGAR